MVKIVCPAIFAEIINFSTFAKKIVYAHYIDFADLCGISFFYNKGQTDFYTSRSDGVFMDCSQCNASFVFQRLGGTNIRWLILHCCWSNCICCRNNYSKQDS